MEDMPDWREQLSHVSYESILAENEEWWSEVWKKSDIEIYGDEENQQESDIAFSDDADVSRCKSREITLEQKV